MSFKDTVDEPSHLGRIGKVEIGHLEYGSFADFTPRTAIGGIAQDLKAWWLVHLQIPISPSLVLLLLIVDLLLAITLGP